MEGDNVFFSHLMALHVNAVTHLSIKKISVEEVFISLLRSAWIFSMFSGVFSNQADLAPNFAGTYQKWEKQKHPSQVPWWPWPTCWPPSLASLCPPLWASWPMARTAWHLGTLVSFSYSWQSWHTWWVFDILALNPLRSVWSNRWSSSLWSCPFFHLGQGGYTGGRSI